MDWYQGLMLGIALVTFVVEVVYTLKNKKK